MIVAWISIGVGCAGLVYVAALLIDVMHDVDTAPRKHMVVCGTHGLIAEDSQITLFDEMEVEGTMRQAIRVCPLCFQNRIDTARKNYK